MRQSENLALGLGSIPESITRHPAMLDSRRRLKCLDEFLIMLERPLAHLQLKSADGRILQKGVTLGVIFLNGISAPTNGCFKFPIEILVEPDHRVRQPGFAAWLRKISEVLV